MDDGALFTRLRQNQRDFKRLQSRGAPHLLRRLELPGVEAFALVGDAERPWSHPVFFDSAGALEEALPTLEGFFAEVGARAWRVVADEADTDTTRLLVSRGYQPGETTWAMGRGLEGESSAPSPGLQVVPTGALLPVQDAVFGPSPDAVRALMRGMVPPAFHAVLSHEVLASGERRPVGAGMSVEAGDTCGIYGVATLPEARRRGHASRVAQGLLAHARARGCRASVLQSTAVARGLYGALGYRTLGVERHWVWRGS